MPKIVCFSGKSNSGKTTLICKVALILREMDLRVNIIKHDPKNKAEFDTQGKEHNKDSFKFSQVAPRVAIISPQKSTILSSNQNNLHPQNLAIDSVDCVSLRESKNTAFKDTSEYECAEFQKIIGFFDDCDVVLIEGLKHLPYPRIVLFREEIDEAYIPYANAFALSSEIASDKHKMTKLPNLPIFDIDTPKQIAEFITKLT